ncbi:MAG: FAD-dependent oxidoreductase [Solobacterium sp.]|nr:FAD-dependent oxidoreductase [Solobacterium sp.]
MYRTSYPSLFSPITIRGVTFRNRIWAAPAGVHLMGLGEDRPNDHVIAYYAEKARGGSAVITFSATNMDLYRGEDPVHSNDNVLKPETHPAFRRLTDAIHFYGAKASMELLAFGYSFPDADGTMHNYTVNGETAPDGTIIHRLERNHLEEIAENYGEAARNAMECGFDMVLVHGGHGLPLFQFLSREANHRTDEFGGSLENRMRFARMILGKIKEKTNGRMLIEYRISGDEHGGPDGFRIDECIEVLKVLQEDIDIAHVSAGSFANHTDHITHPTVFLKSGHNTYLAEAVKKCPEIRIPVLTLGGYQKPAEMEAVLAEGRADIIAMARGTIADADLVNKAMDGKEDKIIPCIRCFNCLDFRNAGRFACSVNPTVGRELELRWIPQNTGKRRIVVIGGGPGGMSAAITAAQRGHEVILYEKSDHLGGAASFSHQVPFKQGLSDFINYQIRMVSRLGIDVRLNTAPSPEEVEQEQPDTIICAVGAQPVRPKITGADQAFVMTAPEIYRASPDDLWGKRIVVIGGGMVGCETGLYLAEEHACEVTIVEMQDTAGKEEYEITQAALQEQLAMHTTVLVNTVCEKIGTHTVFCRSTATGRTQELEADIVLLAAGMRADTANAEQYRGLSRHFFEIGDCTKAGKVLQAVRQGYDAAIQ